MTEIKFCKDCKFCQPDNSMLFSRWKYAKCLANPRQSNNEDFLVTGSTEKKSYYYCSTMRRSPDCGEEGSMFQPK